MIRGYHGTMTRIAQIRALLRPSGHARGADPAGVSSFRARLQNAQRSPSDPADGSREPIQSIISRAAAEHDVSPTLIRALIQAESGFDNTAVSSAGAMGLMQLMPDTCERYGVTDPFDPDQNIDAGVEHLRALMDQFDRLDHVLAAYNAGSAAVRTYGGVPPYPETEGYVRTIFQLLGQ